MSPIRNDVIGAINTFFEDQRKVDVGEVKISLIQFDSEYEENYIAKDIKDVVDLDWNTYVPRGMTALYDAVAKTVIKTGKRFEKMKESARPEKVIFIIQTDGDENSSHEYRDVSVVKQMIEHQTTTYSWDVVFMGANLNAKNLAGNMGINVANAMSYANTTDGFGKAFRSVSCNLTDVRLGTKCDMSYTTQDYISQSEEGINQ